MGSLKIGLEKPLFIWVLIVVVYTAAFWFVFREAPLSDREQSSVVVAEAFAQSPFPPKISLIRELPDWGHLGYHALMGRAHHLVKGNIEKLRLVSLVAMALSFLVFVSLGHHFTYRNRLSPLWISVASLVFAANPYSVLAAMQVNYLSVFLLTLLLAMVFFEKEKIGWSALFASMAVLIDWRALLLAVAFVITRMTGESSKLLRPERLISFVLPFAIAALPLVAWQGVVPQGEARVWWTLFRDKVPFFRADGLFYMLALLPLYPLIFTWAWGIRARSRALVIGAIWTAVLIPLYFLFPVQFDPWVELRTGLQATLGLVDEGLLVAAGPYKNLVLFVPWLAGTFLFTQLLLMDVLDRSRWLRFFIVLFFAAQPFVLGVGDGEILIVLPAILLFSLSEALVGEEGKLA